MEVESTENLFDWGVYGVTKFENSLITGLCGTIPISYVHFSHLYTAEHDPNSCIEK
jgi:hypothetical protein